MSIRVLDPSESVQEALKAFRTFEDGDPELIKTGIKPLDDIVGGLFPGVCGVVGMAEGTGKSSLILTSAFLSPDPVGIISLEDTEDVIGSRILSMHTGINSLRLRKKQLSDDDLDLISSLSPPTGVHIAYAIGGSLDDIEMAVSALGERGCKLIWLDYLQKVRGQSDDRRNDVGRTYTRFQSMCRKVGAAAMVASQFSRKDPDQEPRRHWLKESGDIENEARILLLGWQDRDDPNLVHIKLDKCTFGGERTRFAYMRDESGTLRLVGQRQPDIEDDL